MAENSTHSQQAVEENYRAIYYDFLILTEHVQGEIVSSPESRDKRDWLLARRSDDMTYGFDELLGHTTFGDIHRRPGFQQHFFNVFILMNR